MPSVTGVVQNIASQMRNTKFGQKATYIVSIDGERYNSGFTKPKFNTGDEVSFNFTSGSYGNDIDQPTVRVVAGSTAPAAEPTRSAPVTKTTGAAPQYQQRVFPIPALHGDRAIIRQNALTNAREAIVAKYSIDDSPFPSNENLAKEIIELASQFESWTAGDIDMARAMEATEKKPKAAKKEKVEELFEQD